MRMRTMTMDFAMFVEWELTRACNLACLHCYSRPGEARKHELDTGEALELARSLSRAGCRSLTLSGGEPTLRSDWPRIAETLAAGGAAVQLISNGQTIDRAAARLARSAGVGMVFLSLDGMKASHDRIRRRPGAFDAVLRAAGALDEAGMPFGFITTVLRMNVDDLEPMAVMINRLGAEIWQLWPGIPRGRGSLWLRPVDMERLVDRLRSLRNHCPALIAGDSFGYLRGCEDLRRPGHGSAAAKAFSPKTALLPRFECESGRKVLGIQSDGAVRGCLALSERWNAGSVRDHDLETLWRLSMRVRARRLAGIIESCGDCRFLSTCRGGCHAMALASGGRAYCIEKRGRRRASHGGRRAAALAASVLLASTLATGCRAPSSKAPASNLTTQETGLIQENTGAAPHAPLDPDMQADGAELDTELKESLLKSLSSAVSCECVSEEKDDKGRPLNTQPCICVSHMMCPPSTAWICPQKYTRILKDEGGEEIQLGKKKPAP